MVRENIAAVKELLSGIGFDSGLEQALRAKACYLPVLFQIDYTLNRSGDTCVFVFHIKNTDGIYQCLYYDACYKKEVVVNDDAASSLETRMQLVDWHAVPAPETFDEIESVITDMQTLAAADALHANLLAYKYWAGTLLESKIGGLASLKAQYEISQRFYVTEGSKPISMDEAFRFLQSQWLAKQARRRATPPAPAKARKPSRKAKHQEK
ncbi:MAG TPA: hypothetical protein VG738_19720 [Chitinophagaceae bacterium]|nr:hypothetical protein [Chitinophagaceae bacterium]